jgi:hypothetical protein
VNSAVVHCTLQGFIARLVVRADKGRRAVWNYRVHDVYNATHDIRPASIDSICQHFMCVVLILGLL